MNCSICDRNLDAGKDAMKPDGEGGVVCVPCYCKKMNFVEKRAWRQVSENPPAYDFEVYTDPMDRQVILKAEAVDGMARVYDAEKLEYVYYKDGNGEEQVKVIERDILRRAMGYTESRTFVKMIVENLTTLDEIYSFCEAEGGEYSFIKALTNLHNVDVSKLSGGDAVKLVKAYMGMYPGRELTPVLLESGLDFKTGQWTEVSKTLDIQGVASRALLGVLTSLSDEAKAEVELFLKLKDMAKTSEAEAYDEVREKAKIDMLKAAKLKLDHMEDGVKVKIIKSLDEYQLWFSHNGMEDLKGFQYDVLRPYIYIELTPELRYGFEGDNRISTVYAFGTHDLRCTFEDGVFKFAQYVKISESFTKIPEYVNADLLNKAHDIGLKAWRKEQENT